MSEKVYFFINNATYGNSNVREEYTRCWLENDDIYSCIRKAKNKPYYQYFKFKYDPSSLSRDDKDNNRLLPTNYEPCEFKKLVHFEDAIELGMKVSSQFYNVEKDERMYSQNIQTWG